MYKWLLLLSVLNFSLVTPLIQSQACTDKWALQNVSAWTVYNDKDNSLYQKWINFYTLEDYTQIHIKQANVSVLCDGMVKDFRRLKSFALTNANISKILPEAFQQLPNLTSLSLAVNHIASINPYQFKNLRRLKILYLSSNEIREIEDDAFSALVDLEKIYLDKNEIVEIQEEWFLNNLKIKYINLAFNHITKLQSGAFNLPKSSQVAIHLENNKIRLLEQTAALSDGTDEETPYLTLYLNNNNLTEVPSSFLKSMDDLHSTLIFNSNQINCIYDDVLNLLPEISVRLYVRDNPITCACMEVMKGNLEQTYNMRATFNFSSTNACVLYNFKVPPEWTNNQN